MIGVKSRRDWLKSSALYKTFSHWFQFSFVQFRQWVKLDFGGRMASYQRSLPTRHNKYPNLSVRSFLGLIFISRFYGNWKKAERTSLSIGIRYTKDPVGSEEEGCVDSNGNEWKRVKRTKTIILALNQYIYLRILLSGMACSFLSSCVPNSHYDFHTRKAENKEWQAGKAKPIKRRKFNDSVCVRDCQIIIVMRVMRQ